MKEEKQEIVYQKIIDGFQERWKTLLVERQWKELKNTSELLCETVEKIETKKKEFSKQECIDILKGVLKEKYPEEINEDIESMQQEELTDLIVIIQKTLEILAAGLGSRFGGLKQLEPVGPHGEFIIDYAIYDAIRSGFSKISITVRKDIIEEFKKTIGARIEKLIKVEYNFQDPKDVPAGVTVPEDRTKPLGTSHALWCSRNSLTGKFAIVSADDFYGSDALYQASNHMSNSDDGAIIGYKIGDTLSDNGSVKRGVCFEENGYLTRIVESKVERINGKIVCTPLNGEPSFTVEEDHPVSMLFFVVNKKVIDEIGKEMPEESRKHQDEMNDYEFLFPDTIDRMMQQGKIKVKVVPTDATWYGITYKEDLETLRNAIKHAIDEGIYPEDLWGVSEQDKSEKVKIKRK